METVAEDLIWTIAAAVMVGGVIAVALLVAATVRHWHEVAGCGISARVSSISPAAGRPEEHQPRPTIDAPLGTSVDALLGTSAEASLAGRTTLPALDGPTARRRRRTAAHPHLRRKRAGSPPRR